MKHQRTILTIMLALALCMGCATINEIINPTATLETWAETNLEGYKEIRNTAAMDYRAGKLDVDTYNKIREALCRYTTANNMAYEQYAVTRNDDLLMAQVNTAMAALKKEVEKIREGGAE